MNVYVLDTGVDATHPEFQTASGTRVKCAYSVDAGATTGPGGERHTGPVDAGHQPLHQLCPVVPQLAPQTMATLSHVQAL